MKSSCWMDDLHVDKKSRRLVPSRPVTRKVQMRSEEMERTNIGNLYGQRPAQESRKTSVRNGTPRIESSANSIWQLICDVCNSLFIFQYIHIPTTVGIHSL